MNSEIFGDLNQTSADFNRADALSSVLVRGTDIATVPALINNLNDDRRLGVTAGSAPIGQLHDGLRPAARPAVASRTHG